VLQTSLAGRVALLIGVIAGVAGCAGDSVYGHRYETPIPEGSTVVLEQPLELASGSARAFMQSGEVIRPGLLSGVDRFRPVCSFGLEKVDDEPLIRKIEPDRFETGEQYNTTHVRAWPAEGLQVANMGGAGPYPGFLTYEVQIPLASPRQPQVDDLTCEVDRPPNWNGELGLETIAEAVGDIVRIERAP